jgi:hypothetical protein
MELNMETINGYHNDMINSFFQYVFPSKKLRFLLGSSNIMDNRVTHYYN